MSGLNYEAELFKSGLLTSLKVKQHDYDVIEVTFRRNLKDDKGNIIVDNHYTMFYSKNEFKDFFLPLINTLKERFDNDDPTTSE
jgi:hypothetical protein